jgi:hypothetical protein
MKRTACLGALLLAMIACAAALSKPAPLHALLCCDNGGYTTSLYWVMKPTCSEAQSAFRALALPEAQAYCGGVTRVCGATVPPCYYYSDASQWVVSGPLTYGCKEDCGPIYP